MATEAELQERRLRAEALRTEIRAARMEIADAQTGASSELEKAQLDAEIARLERERDAVVEERDGSVEAAMKVMQEAADAADPVGASQRRLEEEIRNAPLPSEQGADLVPDQTEGRETGDLVPNQTGSSDLGVLAGANVPEDKVTQSTRAVDADLQAAVEKAKADERAADAQITERGESAGEVGTTATGRKKGGSR